MTFEIPYPCLKCDYQANCSWLQVKLDMDKDTTDNDQHQAEYCQKKIKHLTVGLWKAKDILTKSKQGGKHNGKFKRRSKGIRATNNKKHS